MTNSAPRTTEDGRYERRPFRFTDRITADGRDGRPAEPERYRLVVSRACPWASRTLVTRRLMGLEKAISVAAADPIQDDRSWRFTLDPGAAVYEAGFATRQSAYEDAYQRVFACLDWLSERLRTQRYPVGDTITEADIRVFTTLIRFDAVYDGHFTWNRNKITEMPVIWAYLRDLFLTPGFGETVDLDHTKRHYHQAHTNINPTQLVPVGPDLSGLTSPHGGDKPGGRPFGDGTPPGPPPDDEVIAQQL